jgi:hypothetical protein
MTIAPILRYFDLQSHRRPVHGPRRSDGPMQPAPVIPQYLALAAGVAVQPFLSLYIEQRVWGITLTATLAQVAFGLVMAVCIFPGVYKNAFDPAKPLFVQLCAIFTAGIGWQSLFKTGAKLVGATS